MNCYKVLSKQVFQKDTYSLVPIRYEDRFDIMKWRNEQVYHLRQKDLLTIDTQNQYFNNIIANLFKQKRPDQILFSFLENNLCVGYGGLVHINWEDKNAEISFIMKTDLEENNFDKYWIQFLDLIEKAAFNELKFHKIYTYAFDLRPHLYKVLIKSGYQEEARLKEHCFYQGNYLDILIHTKVND